MLWRGWSTQKMTFQGREICVFDQAESKSAAGQCGLKFCVAMKFQC